MRKISTGRQQQLILTWPAVRCPSKLGPTRSKNNREISAGQTAESVFHGSAAKSHSGGLHVTESLFEEQPFLFSTSGGLCTHRDRHTRLSCDS